MLFRSKKSFLDSAFHQYVNLAAQVKFNYVEKQPERKIKGIYDFKVNEKTGGIDRIYFANDSLVFSENNHLFEYIYSKGISPQTFAYPSNVTVKNIAENHDKKYVQVKLELPCSNTVNVFYSLRKEDGVIRMSTSFNKFLEKDKESLHLSVGTGTNGTLSYGKDGTELVFNKSQLPGSNADFICTTDAFKINNGKHTACYYSPQLNLVEVGSLINEEQVNGAKVWKEKTSDISQMYLYLFNNYWHTNYKAYQEGSFLYQVDFWME